MTHLSGPVHVGLISDAIEVGEEELSVGLVVHVSVLRSSAKGEEVPRHVDGERGSCSAWTGPYGELHWPLPQRCDLGRGVVPVALDAKLHT